MSKPKKMPKKLESSVETLGYVKQRIESYRFDVNLSEQEQRNFWYAVQQIDDAIELIKEGK